MRIVYMGTPSFSAEILSHVAERHEVLAVFTRPDAVRSRGKKLEHSPVKAQALQLGIPVYTPKNFRDEEAVQTLIDLDPDVICVAAYGALLPKRVLDIPKHGCLNVHVSLLPRWRGAAPIEHAILAGDEYTGVSIMRMEEGLDTGPYCLCERLSLQGKSAEEVLESMGGIGAKALLQAVEGLEDGTLEWIAQEEGCCTYASKIEKGQLDPRPQESASLFVRKVRASSKTHPAKLILNGKTLAVASAKPLQAEEGTTACCAPDSGCVRFAAKRLLFGCSDGTVELLRVKPDGKQEMDAAAFAAGIQGIKSGTLRWECCQNEGCTGE